LYATASLPHIIKALGKKKYKEIGVELMSKDSSGSLKKEKFFWKKL